MVQKGKVMVLDVDGVLCKIKPQGKDYLDLEPNFPVLEKVKKYKEEGFYIILFSSRNMRTYEGNVGKINANTLKHLLTWLEKWKIYYDEIHVGKPWCGHEGFYVDDKAIRPSEFLNLSYQEIKELLDKEVK